MVVDYVKLLLICMQAANLRKYLFKNFHRTGSPSDFYNYSNWRLCIYNTPIKKQEKNYLEISVLEFEIILFFTRPLANHETL